ncbi:MAG: hypothetical protein ACAH59_12320 [Pseudobdellovibrionaceae bacterium]
MSSQAFFWVNVGLGLFLVLIFIVGKKGFVAPSKLNLKKDSRFGKTPVKTTNQTAQFQDPEIFDEQNEKSLNVLFMYNGHNFDAYEVLGLPAGASFEMVQKYYQAAIAKKGEDREFIDAAFFAIQRTQKKS